MNDFKQRNQQIEIARQLNSAQFSLFKLPLEMSDPYGETRLQSNSDIMNRNWHPTLGVFPSSQHPGGSSGLVSPQITVREKAHFKLPRESD